MRKTYRIAIDGWTKQQAIEEMTQGGYGFHSIWRNLPRFLQNLNVGEIKAKAGLK